MYLDLILLSRKYSTRHLITLLVLVSLVGGVILLFYRELYLIDYITQTIDPIKVPFYFFFLIIFLILSIRSYQWICAFSKRDKRYKFTQQSWTKDWIWNGKTKPLSNSELYINSSRAGCLLKNFTWKSFKMTFKIRFKNQEEFNYDKHLGIVFRAVDLDNYFMLEICQESRHCDGNSAIKPHLRYESGWELMDYEIKVFDFSNKFENIVLEVKDEIAILRFYDNEFSWILPTHVDVNHLESGVKQKENQNNDITGISVTRNVQEIPFRTEYGMIGFRAHPGQGAIIRGLTVEPL